MMLDHPKTWVHDFDCTCGCHADEAPDVMSWRRIIGLPALGVLIPTAISAAIDWHGTVQLLRDMVMP